MKIEIVAIGNELLSGVTVNTNAAYISQTLTAAGWRVSRHTVFPDDLESLRLGLSEAVHCNDLVIATGGLGPTCDDNTRQVAAELFRSDFKIDLALEQDLKKRYKNLPTLRDQATVPTKAKILKNRFGTAPGLIFQDRSTLIVLPGVPTEMREMLKLEVIPFLEKNFAVDSIQLRKKIFLVGVPEAALSEAMVDPILRDIKKRFKKIEIGIYPSHGLLTIQLVSDNKKTLDKADLIIREKFSAYIVDLPSGSIEEAVHQKFTASNFTLALAESFTGGHLAARLTQLPGASNYFLGSLVTYSNDLKSKLLDVSPSVIEKEGSVSNKVVKEMLEGVFKMTKAEFGVACTGIAGPSGGTQDRPVGYVWAAVGRRSHPPFIWNFVAPGNREIVIEYSINTILAQLLRYAESVSTSV